MLTGAWSVGGRATRRGRPAPRDRRPSGPGAPRAAPRRARPRGRRRSCRRRAAPRSPRRPRPPAPRSKMARIGLARPDLGGDHDAVQQRREPGVVEHAAQRHVPVAHDDAPDAQRAAAPRARRGTSGYGRKRSEPQQRIAQVADAARALRAAPRAAPPCSGRAGRRARRGPGRLVVVRPVVGHLVEQRGPRLVLADRHPARGELARPARGQGAGSSTSVPSASSRTARRLKRPSARSRRAR